ncbi:DUF2779 domain-containing protein [Leptospira sp. 96542]|nr:DUF2779 domain-containing protein [Leptospira sp. 96542]
MPIGKKIFINTWKTGLKRTNLYNPDSPITKSQFLTYFRCANAFRIVREALVEKSQPPFGGSLEWFEFLEICRLRFENFPIIDRKQNKEEATNQTIEYLTQKKSVFQAHIKSEHFFTIVECLEYDSLSDGFFVWDFRPVGSIKLDILRSFYFHKQVLEEIGFKVSGFKLFRINTKLIFDGSKPYPQEILQFDDLTQRMVSDENHRKEEWENFENYLKTRPPIQFLNPEPTCRSIKNCLSPNHCLEGENRILEIFDLRDSSEIAKPLFSEGYQTYASLPNESLSPIQKIQKDAHVTNTAYIAHAQLRQFLTNVTKNVAFLDFESINPVLPLFPKTKPFQHVPFLYSLHIWDSEKDELIHKTYVHKENTDPRKSILESLERDLPLGITIISFNDFFEKLIIQESAEVYNEHLNFWEAVKPMFLDLALPFKNFWIYHPAQNGKASLKDILPALSSENHKGLKIREGQDANYQYLRLLKKQVTDEEKKRVLEDLEEYCKLDSFGLFLIYRKIQEYLSVSQC